MLRKLMVLGGVLAMLLVVAAPTFAQEGPVTATGVLGEPYTEGEDPTIQYPFTDEATGDPYVLVSGFVDLSPFLGQQITIEAAPIGTADGATPALNVTSVKGAPSEDARMVGVIQPVAQPSPQGPTHIITDETMGDDYGLFSDAQGVDLSRYEGQRVALQGIYQNMLNPQPESTGDILVYVTSLEVLGDDPAETPDATITGVIQPTANPLEEGSTHTITEDATGDEYGLFSNLQDDGVDLSQYVGQRVTITGYFQTQGTGTAGYDLIDLLIYVESVEVLGNAPVPGNQYQDKSTTVVDDPASEDAAPTVEIPATEAPTTDSPDEVGGTTSYEGGGTTVAASPITGESVLPDTGGFSAVTLGLISVVLLGSFGLLAYGHIRQR